MVYNSKFIWSHSFFLIQMVHFYYYHYSLKEPTSLMLAVSYDHVFLSTCSNLVAHFNFCVRFCVLDIFYDSISAELHLIHPFGRRNKCCWLMCHIAGD